MGFPVVQGDQGGIYTLPGIPPLFASFQMVSGSVKTFIGGRAIMLLAQAVTTGGPIVASSLNSVKTLVEGRPVMLGGSITSLSTGWIGGVLQAVGAASSGVSLN